MRTHYLFVLAVLCCTVSSAFAQREVTKVTLTGKDAKLTGLVGHDYDRGNLTGWEGNGAVPATASWDISKLKPGTWHVSILASCEQQNGGKFTISTGSQTTPQMIGYTGGWGTYKTKQLGTLTVTDKDTTFTIVPTKVPPARFLMNLMSVTLERGAYEP